MLLVLKVSSQLPVSDTLKVILLLKLQMLCCVPRDDLAC